MIDANLHDFGGGVGLFRFFVNGARSGAAFCHGRLCCVVVLFVLDLALSLLACVEPRVLPDGRSSALSCVNGHSVVSLLLLISVWC